MKISFTNYQTSLIGGVLFMLVLSTAYTWNIKSANTQLALTGIIRHDTDIEKYRTLGRQQDFACVGRYSTTENNEDYAVGVLISPQWVLTAAHFVEVSSVWLFGENYYRSKRIIKHPNLASLPTGRKAQWDGWDLALIELDRPVTNVEPAIRYRKRTELGAIITKIGYGYVGDGLSGMNSPEVQERLGGNNVIDSIGGLVNGLDLGEDVLLCDFDGPDIDESNQFGSSIPLELEIGGSKGDSGGGVFIEQNGAFQLVGIVSGGLNRELKYGSMLAFARVSSANLWIDSVLNGTAFK